MLQSHIVYRLSTIGGFGPRMWNRINRFFVDPGWLGSRRDRGLDPQLPGITALSLINHHMKKAPAAPGLFSCGGLDFVFPYDRCQKCLVVQPG
jgi:hypothetical protein